MQNFENLSGHQFQPTNMQELGIIACKKVLERGLRVIVNEPKSPLLDLLHLSGAVRLQKCRATGQ